VDGDIFWVFADTSSNSEAELEKAMMHEALAL